jgi:hypothetical protein
MQKPKRREKKIKREKKSYRCQIKPSQFIQATQVWKELLTCHLKGAGASNTCISYLLFLNNILCLLKY